MKPSVKDNATNRFVNILSTGGSPRNHFNYEAKRNPACIPSMKDGAGAVLYA